MQRLPHFRAQGSGVVTLVPTLDPGSLRDFGLCGVTLSLFLFVFDFGPPPRFTALCACLVALGARAQA